MTQPQPTIEPAKLRCPGISEYGYSTGARTVHMGGCCERFAALPPARQALRGVPIKPTEARQP